MKEKLTDKARKISRLDIVFFVLAALLALSLRDYLASAVSEKEIDFSEYRALVERNAVSDVVVGRTKITGTYKTGKADETQRFSTIRVDPEIADALQKHGVKYKGEPPPGAQELLARETLGTADLERLKQKLAPVLLPVGDEALVGCTGSAA